MANHKTTEEKAEYFKEVLGSMIADMQLVHATMLFYHAEVPVEQARQYIQVLTTKMLKNRAKRAANNVRGMK